MGNNTLINPVFQMFECQNPDCTLRIPSNLTEEVLEICPFCKQQMKPVGEKFQNELHQQRGSRPEKPHLHLLLDNLRSVFNVGSIFRTANGAGVEQIYCCGTTPTPEHPKFVKSGLGAEETVNWVYVRNNLSILQSIKKQGFHVVSLEISSNSRPIFGFSHHAGFADKVLLVVGNEVSGIDPAILAWSDAKLHIPMLGQKTSLNVAIAAAIAIYTYRFNLVSSKELPES